MYSIKTTRTLLSLTLILGIFSSFVVSSLQVQAEPTPTVTLSPTVIAKLDAFIVKVQTLRSKYPSDADWNMFLDNLSKKIIALKPKYIENSLIIAVLNRLNSGVNGLKVQENTVVSATTTNSGVVPPISNNQPLGSPLDSGPLKNTNVVLKFIDSRNNSDDENRAIMNTNNLPTGNVVTGAVTLNVLMWNAFRFSMDYGESRSFQFTTGPVGELYNFETGDTTIVGNYTWIFANISTMPNDFRYDNLDIKNGCAGFAETGIYAQVINPNDYSRLMHCRLKPSTTYYLNIRNERIDLANRNGNQRGKDTCNFNIDGHVDINGNTGRDCGFVMKAQLNGIMPILTAPDPTISALKIPQEYAK